MKKRIPAWWWMFLAAVALVLPACGSTTSEKACTLGEDCASGFCFERRCVGCLETEDCQRTQTCVEHACVARLRCNASGLCDRGVCVDGICMDCVKVTDCGEGMSCIDQICVKSEEECTGAASCGNHGRCDDTTGSIVCTCDKGYMGERCGECADGYKDYGDGSCRLTNPCVNDTQCAPQNRECVNSQGAATCGNCLAGFHEENQVCVADRTCQDNSCSGHGICSDSGGTVTCDCATGYSGTHCESCASGYAPWPIDGDTCVDDPCDPYPCDLPNTVPNGCVQTDADKFICTCKTGFTWNGSNCGGTCQDQDHDGYGSGPDCLGPDCNDNDPKIFPGNPEVCDGKDNDCNDRVDCAGGPCQPGDPCDDQNPCTLDSCDPNGGGCAHEARPPTVETACDPDGPGSEFAEQDGVCSPDTTCRRLKCRLCDEDAQCTDGRCLCADPTCSTKRCFDQALVCQFVAGDNARCGAENTPAQRWGTGCAENDGLACDGSGGCLAIKCAACSFTACAFTARHADCGNSSLCATCAGIDQCNLALLGTSCSKGTPGCENRCDGNGLCQSALGRECGAGACASTCTTTNQCSAGNGTACGGMGVCTGRCNDGACEFPSGNTCGANTCSGSCLNGTCSTSGQDCGTCCTCDGAGLETFDAAQNIDCLGFEPRDPCSNRCASVLSCAPSGGKTACGQGTCAGHCNGSGGCDSYRQACCSSLAPVCTESDECLGVCSATGTCSSAGKPCGVDCGPNCVRGVCGGSGVCHCNEALAGCSVCGNSGRGYEFVLNICKAQDMICCPDSATHFECCSFARCSGLCVDF